MYSTCHSPDESEVSDLKSDNQMTINLISSFSRKCSNQTGLTLVTEKEGIRKITLNNTKKRNALSLSMLNKLKEDIFTNTDDKCLRCVVLDSSGPVFSSGHDLKELNQSSQEARKEIFDRCSQLMLGIRKVEVPVIAVVNGLAAAAGCQLIASCDIVLASTKSQFSTPGASVGLFCSTPGIAVSRAVPAKVASYMLLTGNNLSAEEAVQCGLVSKIAAESDLEQMTEQVLSAILSKSKPVIALGKKFFYEQLDKDIAAAYTKGTEVMVNNLAMDEAKEGISAFFAKRPPRW